MPTEERQQSMKEPTYGEAIAIVGMGCRFPGGVNSPESYWELLKNGTDAIVEVPPERWRNEDFYHPERDKPGKMVTKYGGFIDGIDQFDPETFGISPHEAHRMDPQQRHLLEVTREALEDGGLRPDRLRGTDVGVFIGAFALDYHALQFGDPFQRDAGPYTAASSMMTMISNRISYVYDFQGPSMTVDTACSSSLVTLHLACESLRKGESELALAGGVVLIFTPQYTLVESRGGFLSPEGRCKTFDASADGYVRGEGVGLVVLKRLEDALADGDPIQAVIMASGVNQDGHTVGITVPSSEAQERLIHKTISKAGIRAEEVQYVEAHGTGTPVGDPIEARAIAAAYGYGANRRDQQSLVIGSCKTNIGHTEAAAGVAGLIKTVLCLKHKQIPPNLHFSNPNPDIPFDEWKLRIPVSLEPWPACDGAATAAVNSFGFGGTNAHVIVREAGQWATEAAQVKATATQSAVPSITSPNNARRAYLLPISARKAAGLQRLSESYKQRLAALGHLFASQAQAAHALANMCWSAGARREHHRHRQAVVFHDADALAERLNAASAGNGASSKDTVSGKQPSGDTPKLVWTFSGMGPQWYGMGRQLLQLEPVFYETMKRCDRLFEDIAGWSLLAELARDEADSRMDETDISMPISFALQIALAALWRSWGIVPDAIVGHSAGEVAAFCEAGVYTLDNALLIVYHRSRLLQRLSGRGGMAAVGVSAEVAQELIADYKDTVDIAAINSPVSVTLAGAPECLDQVLALAEKSAYFCRKLRVQAPFHSHYMEDIKEELLESLKNVPAQAETTPLYSTVTAGRVDGAAADAFYWWRNVRETVRFAPVIGKMLEDGYSVFLEIGAHPVLTGALNECFMEQNKLAVASIRRKEDEHEAMMRSLAELYTWGFEPSWQALYPEARWMQVPSYPWQQETYWHEPEMIRQIRLGFRDHPLLGRPLLGAFTAWEGELSLLRFPYLQDHRVLDQTVFPAAGYIEGMMAAVNHAVGGEGFGFVLEELELYRALTLPEHSSVQLTQHYLDVENGTFQIYSAGDTPGSKYTMHAAGRVRQLQPQAPQLTVNPVRLSLTMIRDVDRDTTYRILKNTGFDYGPYFQGVQRAYVGYDEAWAEIVMELQPEEQEGYAFHPRLMDSCFQTLLAAEFPLEGETPKESREEFRLPVRIEQVRFYRTVSGRLWAHSLLTERNDTYTKGDLRIYDQQGRLVAEFLGFVKQAVDAGFGKISGTQLKRWFYELQWQLAPDVIDYATRVTKKDAWIFFGDRGGVAQAAAMLLREQDYDAMIVDAATDGTYHFSPSLLGSQIDPAQPNHYDRLLKDALHAYGNRLRGIVHCWNMDLPEARQLFSAGDAIADSYWTDQKIGGSLSLLYAAQSISSQRADVRIWAITRGAQPVVRGEEAANGNLPALLQASAWGLGRAIGQEFRQYWGGMCDLDGDVTATEAAYRLVCELVSGEAGKEDQIAYRGDQRYMLRLHADERIPELSLPLRCREDGSYLITGAFGSIGREVAKLLVKRGARRLILIGRSSLPERSQWKAHLSGEVPTDSLSRITFVQQLEAAGAHVLTIALNVADRKAVAEFMREYDNCGMPPIRGVIHSAGAVKDVLLEQMTAEKFNEAYDAKVLGAWHLHEATLKQPLEFFVLFSSLASLLPPAGQGNYAAGNAFMDALAHYRKGQGLPAISINWGPWIVGMVDKLNLTAHFQENGIDCLRSGEGIAVLEHLIGQHVAQVAVLSAEWRSVRTLYPDTALLNALDQMVQTNGAYTIEEMNWTEWLLSIDASERGPAVMGQWTSIIAELLHYDKDAIDITRSLPEIGLDSMMAVKLRSRVQNQLGSAPMIGDLLSGRTIEELGRKLAEPFLLEASPAIIG